MTFARTWCTWAAALLLGAALAAWPGGGRAQAAAHMTLAEAWALAEAHHPRVVEARRTLEGLERDLEQRRSAYAPTLTVSVGRLSARVDTSGEWDTPNPDATLRAGLKLPSGINLNASVTSPALSSENGRWRGNVSLEYPLLRSAELDSDALALRQAEQALENARLEFERLRDEVRAEVLAALHALQVAQVRFELARAAHADAAAEWDLAQRHKELGIITEAEYLAAQIAWLRAEQDWLTAQRTLEARRRDLARMLGLDDVAGYEFEDVLGWTAMPPAGSPDEAAARATARSLTVRERRQAVETAELQLAAERERSGWTASFSATYVPRGSGTQEQRDGLSLSVSLSYPLADGGQRRRSLAAREEAVERALEALERAEEEVRQQVLDLFVQLEDARREVDIAGLELARAELEYAAVLRQAGLPVAAAGQADVERARRAVVRAELSWLEAVQRYQARWIELQRLQGPVPWETLMTAPEGEGTR